MYSGDLIFIKNSLCKDSGECLWGLVDILLNAYGLGWLVLRGKLEHFFFGTLISYGWVCTQGCRDSVTCWIYNVL